MRYYGSIGTLHARKGKGSELASILMEAAELLRKNMGCIQYLIATQSENPDIIHVTELWRSREDHHESLREENVRQLIQKALPHLDAVPPKSIATQLVGGFSNLNEIHGSP